MREGGRARPTSTFEEGALELGGVEPLPGPQGNPRKDQTKYPFGELTVGQTMLVRRSLASVKSAIQRYVKVNKGKKQRFVARRMADGRVKVWRMT